MNNMVTIAHLVKQELGQRPLLLEYLARGLINYTALAESLAPGIARQLGKDVAIPAVVMALRRQAEGLAMARHSSERIEQSSELLMKTNLVDVTVRRSPQLFAKLLRLYSLSRGAEGYALNVVHGNYEASIIFNSQHEQQFLSVLKGEKILKVDRGLVSISLRFSDRFRATPGIIAAVTAKLMFENINLLEIVSTNTELALVVSGRDAMRAYAALEDFTKKKE